MNHPTAEATTLGTGEGNEHQYRQAEETLWAHAEVTPIEQRIHFDTLDGDIRVQDVGDGPPLLVLHMDGPTAGACWALLATQLPNRRCLFVDRPGYGLSNSLLLDTPGWKTFGDQFVAEVLDALDIDRADLVARSIRSLVVMAAP